MELTTTKFGTKTVDVQSFKRKGRGLNKIVELIIDDVKGDVKVTSKERAQLHVEIRDQLTK